MLNLDPDHILLIALAVMDAAVLAAFLVFMRRTKAGRQEAVQKAAQVLESLLADSGKMAEQWTQQLEAKQELMKRLNAQLDERLSGAAALCTRAESLLQVSRFQPSRPAAALTGQEKRIIALSRTGLGNEEIAGRLSLPREEVDLVVGLDKKLSRLGAEKVAA